MEVSDLAQAKRVASLGIRRPGGQWGGRCEIWRDWDDGGGEEGVGVGEDERERENGGEDSEEAREEVKENENKSQILISSEPPIRIPIKGQGNGRSVFFSSFSSSSSPFT